MSELSCPMLSGSDNHFEQKLSLMPSALDSQGGMTGLVLQLEGGDGGQLPDGTHDG